MSEVFAFMAEPANMPRWTNMASMEYDAPIAPGTTGSAVWKLLGQRRTFRFVTTAYEPERRWAMEMRGALGIRLDYTFQPLDGGTRVEQLVELQPRGWLRPLAPIIALLLASEEAAELRRLKTAVEAG